MIWLELLLIIGLIALNGFLSMAELAIVSSRKPRLKLLANTGSEGAALALKLANDPGPFLSTVQIGITLVGVLAGAFSGATLAERFADYLEEVFPLSETVAETLSLILVVTSVTYLSLIIGELVPKQVALRNPERVASRVAKPMALLRRVAGPAVVVLDASARLCLRLMGKSSLPENKVSEDEIKMLVAEAESAGVLETAEKEMIAGIMRLGNRPASGVMTPRYEIDWINLDSSPEEIAATLRATSHSIIPVARERIDNVEGVILLKDALDIYMKGETPDWSKLARPLTVVPDTLSALQLLESLKESPLHAVLVADEHGSFEGIVTTTDVLEAIAGSFRDPDGEEEEIEPDAFRREDGTWLLDGTLPVDEMADRLMLPMPDKRNFQTVAGFVLFSLKTVPRTGASFDWSGWRFEVVDMDGRRVDKVLAQPLPADKS
jgi:putative hemolysin